MSLSVGIGEFNFKPMYEYSRERLNTKCVAVESMILSAIQDSRQKT